MIDRRNFLTGAAAGMSLPFSARLAWATTGDGFVEIVAMPVRRRVGGTQKALSDLWTFSETVPGPEIRVRKGERVRVRLVNRLEEPTSIHWHGIRIDNAMDGVPGLTQEPVAPGQSFEYDFVAPDAGTYWYHSHFKSWRQVERGLYGPLIVEGDAEGFERENDQTLVLDDWRLNRDDALDLESFGSLMDWSHAGRLGNWLTVNGRSRPEFALKAGQFHRLRLVNAANARILAIDAGRIGARLIALDGQVFSEPRELAEGPLLLGPAQRADLLVVPDAAGTLELNEVSGSEPLTFARLNVAPGGAPGAAPAYLANALPEPAIEDARKIVLRMTGGAMRPMGDIVHEGRTLGPEDVRRTGQLWAFNGIANLADDPLFTASRGETLILETHNHTAFPHAIHVHGHHFRVVGQDGDGMETDRSLRDTFLIAPDAVTRIAFVADNPGKWMLHCHMLEHAAAGMMTWFDVG